MKSPRLWIALALAAPLLMVGAYEGWSAWRASQRQTAIETVARAMAKCGWGYDLPRAESYVVQVHLVMGLDWQGAADLFRTSTSCGVEGR